MVHSAIVRTVRPGAEGEFEQALREFFSTAVCDPNTTGAQVIKPFNGSDERRYGILRSFPDEAAREAFYDSPAYHEWSEHVEPMVVGPAERRDLHGLEAFFAQSGEGAPPPTWKMALITWIGVNLVTTPLLVVLMPILVGSFSLRFPFDNFVFNLFVVSLLSWVVMPGLVKLFGPWLSRPVKAAGSAGDVPAGPASESPVAKAWSFLAARRPGEAIRDWGLSLLSLGTGLLMAVFHGWPKVAAAPGYFLNGQPWRDVDLVVALGLPFPGIMATIAGLIQFVSSLFVAVGYKTRINALLVLSTLSVALYWNAVEGKDNQLALMYAIGFAVIALAGAGKLSFDRLKGG